MYCHSCGNQNQKDAVFCSSCGVKIHDSVNKSNESTISVAKKQESFQKGEVKQYQLASISDRFASLLIDYIFIGVLLGIGWIVWWLIILHRGQTPGKQLVGIYTAFVKSPDMPVSWGYGFLRDIFFKLGLIYIIVSVIFTVTLEIFQLGTGFFWILILIDHCWSFWDKSENKQTLHDKIFNTSVYKKK